MALPAVGSGEQVGDGNLNETLNVGRATQPVQLAGSGGTWGVYGATPVSQRSTTLGATVATTVAVSTTTGATTSWGFSTSTQANNIVSLLNSVYGALTSVGIIST